MIPSIKRLKLFLPAIFCFFLFFPSQPTTGEEFSGKRRSPVVMAVEKAGPAVVNINTEEVVSTANPFYSRRDDIFRDFFRDYYSRAPREQKKRSLGSGVLIRPEGYILTNHHVVSKATSIKVTLSDKREFEAKLVGADPRSDIAVIKIEAKGKLPYVKMGRSDDLMNGETVIAIGNPFGLSNTVTTGVISAIGRDIHLKNQIFTDFIQLDASINPGNSGGPLLNIEGSLIGINSAIYQQAEGIGFAIPINRAKRIVKELIRYGKVHQAWMGLFLQDMDARVAAYFGMKAGQGVLVSRVFKGGPAEHSGIKQGDIILEINGKRVLSKRGYFESLASSAPNDVLSLTYTRDNKIRETSITARKIPEKKALEIAKEWLGFEVVPITKKSVYYYNLQTDAGVVVSAVMPGGVAYNIGIRPGDVVRQVNQDKITDISDFRKAVVDSWLKYSVLFMVQRGRYGHYVTLEP